MLSKCLQLTKQLSSSQHKRVDSFYDKVDVIVVLVPIRIEMCTTIHLQVLSLSRIVNFIPCAEYRPPIGSFVYPVILIRFTGMIHLQVLL